MNTRARSFRHSKCYSGYWDFHSLYLSKTRKSSNGYWLQFTICVFLPQSLKLLLKFTTISTTSISTTGRKGSFTLDTFLPKYMPRIKLKVKSVQVYNWEKIIHKLQISKPMIKKQLKSIGLRNLLRLWIARKNGKTCCLQISRTFRITHKN